MPTPKKAAIYARVSAEQQVLKSGLDVQLAECQRFAAQQGIEVVATYKDEGISGAHGVKHREGLDRLLSDAREKRFDTLLVHELDRLARETFVGLNIVGMVDECGVQLIEVSTCTTFQDQGALLGLVKLWGAGEDRKRLLQRTKRGQVERAKQGRVSGPPPLGYDKDNDGRLVINQDEAELVQRIYRLYLDEGHNLDSVAKLLNSEGIQTKRARLNAEGKNRYRGADHWQRSTIQCLFRNPVYKGTYIYGKTQGRVRAGNEYEGNAKRPIQSPSIETAIKNRKFLSHEIVEVTVPAIVDAEIWERAQTQLGERYRRMRFREGASKYNYLFDGMVRCHDCGRVMTRMTMAQKRKRGNTYTKAYYTCRNTDKSCPNAHKHHPMHVVDWLIVARLLPYLENPNLIREGYGDLLKLQAEQAAEIQQKVKAVERHLSEILRQQQKLLDAFLADIIPAEELKTKRLSLDDDAARLQKEIDGLKQELAESSYEEDRLKLEAVVEVFERIALVEKPFERFVASVRVNFDDPKLEATLPIKLDGPQLIRSEPDEGLVRLAQNLVKRVTVNRQGLLEDFVLRIRTLPPPSEPSSGNGENHTLNLKCITSPSFTS